MDIRIWRTHIQTLTMHRASPIFKRFNPISGIRAGGFRLRVPFTRFAISVTRGVGRSIRAEREARS